MLKIEQVDQSDESLSHRPPTSVDPFATDLFMAASAAARRARASQHSITAVNWHSYLKQITPEQARISATLATLPAGLSVKAAESALALYTQAEANGAKVGLADLREAQLDSVLAQQSATSSVFAHLLAEPGGHPIALEIDASFAEALIDRALGGAGALPDEHRALSLAEAAIFEFLCLMIVRQFNQELGDPLIRLERVLASPPQWLKAKQPMARPNDATYGLIATFRVSVLTTAGFARLYAPANALVSLSNSARASGNSLILYREKLKRFAAIAPCVSAWLAIGRSEVTAGDLAQLECGDVMLIEQPHILWTNGRISGKLRIRIGDGYETAINGQAAPPSGNNQNSSQAEIPGNHPATIDLIIETISGGGSMTLAERFNMEETIRSEEIEDNIEVENEALLDGLLLTAHVEMAARSIRLDELAQLRAGQILKLGCKATDPVDLVVDGRTIARGELVDIEGSLGVRIIQVAS